MDDPPCDHILLGDLLIMEPGRAAPKLMKAAAVLAKHLHKTISADMRRPAGKSKESCVLTALTARDFLNRIGIEARVMPVVCAMEAKRDGKVLHSLGIGVPDAAFTRAAEAAGRWNGHLIVAAGGFLIDPTIYQAIRPQWDFLPGMIMARLDRRLENLGLDYLAGLETLASATMIADGDPGYQFQIIWLDHPANRSWRNGPDAHIANRRGEAKALAGQFGPWRAGRRHG